MNHISPRSEPQRVPPVDADLLASAIFLVSEYVAERAAEEAALRDDEEEDEEEEKEETVPVDARAVLDRLAEELATDPKTTLALYMRLTALFRLLSSSRQLAAVATDPEGGDALTPQALAAAATLELYPNPESETPGDFDPREFSAALETDR
jgi:hypothetical protein